MYICRSKPLLLNFLSYSWKRLAEEELVWNLDNSAPLWTIPSLQDEWVGSRWGASYLTQKLHKATTKLLLDFNNSMWEKTLNQTSWFRSWDADKLMTRFFFFNVQANYTSGSRGLFCQINQRVCKLTLSLNTHVCFLSLTWCRSSLPGVQRGQYFIRTVYAQQKRGLTKPRL